MNGSPACPVNAKSTQDCLLQITFTPTAAGLLTSTLPVAAQLGASQNFALSGLSNLPGAADSISLATTTPANGILVYGQPAGFTATVTPQTGTQTPTGTIAFTVDGVTLCPHRNVLRLRHLHQLQPDGGQPHHLCHVTRATRPSPRSPPPRQSWF